MLQFMGLQRVGHDWVAELNPLCIACFWDVDEHYIWSLRNITSFSMTPCIRVRKYLDFFFFFFLLNATIWLSSYILVFQISVLGQLDPMLVSHHYTVFLKLQWPVPFTVTDFFTESCHSLGNKLGHEKWTIHWYLELIPVPGDSKFLENHQSV